MLITMPAVSFPIAMPIPIMVAIIRPHDIRIGVDVTRIIFPAIIGVGVFTGNTYIGSTVSAPRHAARETQQKACKDETKKCLHKQILQLKPAAAFAPPLWGQTSPTCGWKRV